MKRIALLAALATLAHVGHAHAVDDVPPILSPLDSTGIRHAVRLEPPKPLPPPVLWTTESAGSRCVGMVGALTHFSPGWDVQRMAGIAWRESRCDPNASNSCCSGIMQIHRSWISQLGHCGVHSRSDLYDPWKNICSAAHIYLVQGVTAWSTA